MTTKALEKRPPVAATILAAALSKRGLSVNEASAEIGAPSGLMSRWLRGERTPTIRWAAKIDRRFRVPIHQWVEFPAVEAARRTPEAPALAATGS